MEKFEISQPDKERLESLGFKEYKGRLLASWANPFSNTYMAINCVLFASCLVARYY